MPAPCTAFTTRPKARKDTPSPAFSFGRVLDGLTKYRNSIDYAEIKRHLPPFSGVFGVFLAAFWTYSGKEPKNTGAAETARRVCQLTNTKRPALFLLWRYTRRVFDMDETGAGRLRTFWYRFSYQKVNQTCTTWLQILYQIRRTEEGKARRAAFLVV